MIFIFWNSDLPYNIAHYIINYAYIKIKIIEKIFWIVVTDVQMHQNTTRGTFNKNVDKWRHVLPDTPHWPTVSWLTWSPPDWPGIPLTDPESLTDLESPWLTQSPSDWPRVSWLTRVALNDPKSADWPGPRFTNPNYSKNGVGYPQNGVAYSKIWRHLRPIHQPE